MKTMRIEKNLRLHEPVEEVLNIYVSEGLKYSREEDGIRAVGPVYIKGQYMSNHTQKPFQDVLEMDVLAPLEKLGSGDFHLEIHDYEANANDDQIKVQIVFGIRGLKEDEHNEPIEVKEEPQVSTVMKTSQKETETDETTDPRLNKQSPSKKQETDVVNKDEEQKEEVPDTEDQKVDGLEDLFEDAGQVYTSYRIIVAKPNDTYASIAQRYEVEEMSLRDTNRNKEIQAKSLVILPYAQSMTNETTGS